MFAFFSVTGGVLPPDAKPPQLVEVRPPSFLPYIEHSEASPQLTQNETFTRTPAVPQA